MTTSVSEMNEDEISGLQARRAAQARERRKAELRSKNGPRVIAAVSEILGDQFAEVDLNTVPTRPTPSISKRIEDSPGLVAAYIGFARARQILTCCQSVFRGSISATVWLDEKDYVGPFHFQLLDLSRIADLAMHVEDRVLISPVGEDLIIIVDYYQQSWTSKPTDFSVLLQGSDAESKFANCFEEIDSPDSRL